MMDPNAEKTEIVVPSKLREANSRHDSIKERINTIRKHADKLGLHSPVEYREDEHYWFTVMNRNHVITTLLKDIFSDQNQLKMLSMAIAMNEAGEFMKLEKMKFTDGLTKAWSRDALDNFLENLRSKPRKGLTTGVMFVDIDNFKKYNDEGGHAKGDEVLANLVKTIKTNIRGVDMVGRYGGEEFAIVLPNLPIELSAAGTTGKAEQIRKAIEKECGVTVSMGATTVNESDMSVSDIYRRVDGFLAQAKNAGKNVVYSDNGSIEKKE